MHGGELLGGWNMSESVTAAAGNLVAAARAAGLTVATAESLTAGQIAAAIAAIPGASAVLRGGLIVYATDLKHGLAGVDADLLAQHGPVNAGVVRELAAGAARRCGADIGIGATGVAGPDSQDGHPVGEVYLAVWADSPGADGGGDRAVDRVCVLGDDGDDGDDTWRVDEPGATGGGAEIRSRIRQAATRRALAFALEAVQDRGPRP